MNVDAAYQQPIVFLIGFLVLILSVGIHEFAHVYSAYLQGDQTGRLMGRLTLNPIRHLDPLGTIFMFVSMLAGVGIGWGKPAPFNPSALRYRRWGSFFVAIAGPISNILFVMLAGYTYKFLFPGLPEGNLLGIFLGLVMLVNAGLAVFNLLPISPLDGSHLLEALLGEGHPLNVFLRRYGFFILLGLIFFGQSLIGAWVVGGIRFLFGILGLS